MNTLTLTRTLTIVIVVVVVGLVSFLFFVFIAGNFFAFANFQKRSSIVQSVRIE